MIDYYNTQFQKSLQRIRSEANYCMVLLPVVEDLQETEKALEEMEKAIYGLKKEYNARLYRLRMPKDCNPEEPTLKRCENCPNIGASLDAHPLCKMTLRALD